ncbi:MAG: hypothetical protein QME66_13720, partial [Candidatus Eisenbacteria bacterium]|nr:hypothetical protein [Candidatus Eisenbacteria bacterium]
SIANDTTVYVEGLSPSVNMDGETITLRVYNGTQLICEDKVKLIVAQTMFGIFGDGGAGESTLRTYLNAEKKDQRTDPYVIKKATACYSVFVWTSEKLAKIALGAEEGYVAYDGHSNFGIGFTFSGNLANIAAFMNVGEALVPINWPYMRDHQGHPNFWIEDAEYGDDTTSTEQYDPWRKTRSIVGSLQTLSTYEFFSTPQTGGDVAHLHLTRGANKYEDYHYGTVVSPRIVAKCGAADMPTRRWKKAFLNSCDSGRYYYRIFNHGTFFYTRGDCSASGTTKAFIKAIIDGKDNGGILNDVNAVENVNDYHSF